jgi:DNA-binding beta-propeller fold protein YncE
MKRNLYVGAIFLFLLAAFGTASLVLQKRATAEAAGVQAPIFEVDPMWPKPLPNHWLLGQTIGVSVDAQDHVWIIHRGGSLEAKEIYATANPPAASCCVPAPPVLEFDQEGNLIGHWGGPGPGYDWPQSNHGITVDYKGNVWIGGNGRAQAGPNQISGAGAAPEGIGQPARFADNQILKFTQDGKFVMQIGHSNQSKGNADTANVHRAADFWVYPQTNELFVADGYGNHRVIVFDANTGAYKRMWGAFGKTPKDDDHCEVVTPKTFPDPGPDNFSIVHSIKIADDGTVYVADRENRRVQAFTKDGKYLRQIVRGSVPFARNLAFSPDRKFLYVGEGKDIAVLDPKSLKFLGTIKPDGIIGGGHLIAVDSKGDIYIAQTAAGLQKLTYMGMGE